MTRPGPAISRAVQVGSGVVAWRNSLGEHGQPVAHGGGLVVDDVVDGWAVVVECEHGSGRDWRLLAGMFKVLKRAGGNRVITCAAAELAAALG